MANERVGRCYELVAQRALELWQSGYDKRDLKIVHGVIRDTNFDNKGALVCHAWLVIRDRVWEPVAMLEMSEDAFVRMFDAEIVHRYSLETAMWYMGVEGHYGPWLPMPEHLQKTLIDIAKEEANEKDPDRRTGADCTEHTGTG